MSTNGNDFEIVTRGAYVAGQSDDTYYLNLRRIEETYRLIYRWLGQSVINGIG
mgnify:CR=1 FL=1